MFELFKKYTKSIDKLKDLQKEHAVYICPHFQYSTLEISIYLDSNSKSYDIIIYRGIIFKIDDDVNYDNELLDKICDIDV